MIERWFVVNGHVSTALLAAGLVIHGLHSGANASLAMLYLGLLLLILTPVTRVIVAGVRYLLSGDRGAAALAAAILLVIGISAWAGMS